MVDLIRRFIQILINMFELLNRPPAGERYPVLFFPSSTIAYVRFLTIIDPFFDKSVLLLSSAWPIHIVLALYLLFVLNLGKKYMANRKPYDLKNVILIYNIIQVIYNAIMFSFVSMKYIVLKGREHFKLISNRVFTLL